MAVYVRVCICIICFSYANGSIYEGYFHEGRRQGQGLMKQGKITSDLASIYIGEWLADKRQGFGVYDDILKGKYWYIFEAIFLFC